MAEISLTRLTGGNTPADGSDPRTFPAIWNASATAIEDAIAEGGGGSITVSDTAPTVPAPGQGDLWWDSVNGKLFVYYVDGDSSQWVDAAGPSVAVQDTAPTGYEGQLWLDSTDGSMYTYYTDPGGGSSSWIGAVSRSGGILQVVSTTKTDTFSTTSTSFTDVTGLSATITPRSTSSKIYVVADVKWGTSIGSGDSFQFRLNGGNSSAYVGDAAGSRTQALIGAENMSQALYRADLVLFADTFSYLDSPATTSSTTYSVQMRREGGTGYVNRSHLDTDNSKYSRGASSITLIEVAG